VPHAARPTPRATSHLVEERDALARRAALLRHQRVAAAPAERELLLQLSQVAVAPIGRHCLAPRAQPPAATHLLGVRAVVGVRRNAHARAPVRAALGEPAGALVPVPRLEDAPARQQLAVQGRALEVAPRQRLVVREADADGWSEGSGSGSGCADG
jgi:hypothetical protein